MTSRKTTFSKKNEVLEGVCERGCRIRIDGDDVNPYVLEGTEVRPSKGAISTLKGKGRWFLRLPEQPPSLLSPVRKPKS